jgi:GTP-binding protein HflX
MPKEPTYDTHESNIKDRAILVALVSQKQNLEKTKEYLSELEFLATTINIDTIAKFTQSMERPDKRTFVGKGKLEEILFSVKEKEIDCVIFDDDLTPSQVRNLENALDVKIYDRSLLILDIFLFRAQTAQAKTQVELARSQYLLPRLTNLWTHLERQRGGTGTRGGSGEQEIETDKRNIRDTIGRLKARLEKIDKQGITQRKNRGQLARVAIVGYTNVGKSTLMTLLSKSDIFAENKLFATVDSTVRKVVLSYIPFLLTDTVGFIRKLPHGLIECFKSTLDEVREADILMHVVDISHDGYEEQFDIVNNTLAEIGIQEMPTLLVFNKLDSYRYDKTEEFENFDLHLHSINERYSKKNVKVVFTSAKTKENYDELKRELYEFVSEKHYTIFPHFLRQDYVG